MLTQSPVTITIFGLNFANSGQVVQTSAAVFSALIALVAFSFTILSFVRATPERGRRQVWASLATFAFLLSLLLAWLALHEVWPWIGLVAVVLAVAAAIAYGRFGLVTPSLKVTRTVGGRLKVVDSKVSNADHMNHVNFKRKLYIVVQNIGDVEIVIGPGTTWKAGDLKIRAINEQVWEAEGADGWHANKWTHNEVSEIRLKPGKHARTWIGLHDSATAEEVVALKGKVGDLIVPVKVLGEEREQLSL